MTDSRDQHLSLRRHDCAHEATPAVQMCCAVAAIRTATDPQLEKGSQSLKSGPEGHFCVLTVARVAVMLHGCAKVGKMHAAAGHTVCCALRKECSATRTSPAMK